MAIWNSNGAQTGGSGAYVSGTQSVNYILATFAQTGDTITIPAGTFNWSSTTTVTIAITLSGVNPGVTGNTATKAQFTSVIQVQTTGANMLQCTAPNNGHIVLEYLCIVQIANNNTGSTFGVSLDRSDINGPHTALITSPYTCLVHDCYFDAGQIFNYTVAVGCNGIIIWQCTFSSELSTQNLGGVTTVPAKYGPTLDWNTPSCMGAGATLYGVGDTAAGYSGVAGLNNTYIETCTAISLCILNADSNTRAVVRYCTLQDSNVALHGGTSEFAARNCEVYNNDFKNVNSQNLNNGVWVSFRSGTGVVYNNIMDALRSGDSSISLFLENVNRSNYGGAAQTAYPASRQISIGWSSSSGTQYGNPAVSSFGTGQVFEPLYMWNNTGAGAPVANNTIVNVDQYVPDDFGNNLTIAGTVLFNQQSSATSSGSVGSLAATFPGSINGSTAFGLWLNDLLLCMLTWTTSGTPTVTVTDGTNTWTQMGGTYNAATGESQALFATINNGSTATYTVTAHFSSNVSGIFMNIADYAGNWKCVNAAGTITLDGFLNNNSTSSGTVTSGNITTTLGNDLIISWGKSGAALSGISSGWISRSFDGTNHFGFCDHLPISTDPGGNGAYTVTGTYGLTATTTAPWTFSTVAFQSMPFMLNGRDFSVGTAMPSWTPFTYPHPLTGSILYTVPPGAATMSAISGQTSSAVPLAWTPPAETTTGQAPSNLLVYNIYRETIPPSSFTLLATTSQGATSYTDNTVTGATEYGYFIISEDPSSQLSGASNTVTATTPGTTHVFPLAHSSAVSKSAVHGNLRPSAKSKSFGSVTPELKTIVNGLIASGSSHGSGIVRARPILEETILSTFAFVQTNNNSSGVQTFVTCPFLFNITLGNFIVVVIQIAGTDTITSVTDSAGNVYSNAITNSDASNTLTASIYYAPVTAGSGTKPTVTVNYNVGHSAGLFVYEFSGINNGSPIDAAGVSSGNGATGLVPSSTAMASTSNPNDLIIGGVFAKSAITGFEPGWNGQTGSLAGDNSAEYFLVQGTGSYFATWTQTTSSGYTAVVASFSGIASSSVGGNSTGSVPLRLILRPKVLASTISSSKVLYVICQHISAKTVASGTGIAETTHLIPATAKAPGISKSAVTVRLVFEPGPSAECISAATLNINTVFRASSTVVCTGLGITRLIELRRSYTASSKSSGSTSLSRFTLRQPISSASQSVASLAQRIVYRSVYTSSAQSSATETQRLMCRPKPSGTGRIFGITSRSGSIQEEVAFGVCAGSGLAIARPVLKSNIPQSVAITSATDNARFLYRPRVIASSGSIALVATSSFSQRPATAGLCKGSASLSVRQVYRAISIATASSVVSATIRFEVRPRAISAAASLGRTKLSSVSGKTQSFGTSSGSTAIVPRLIMRRALAASTISGAFPGFRYVYRPQPAASILISGVLITRSQQRITLTGGSITMSMVSAPTSVARFPAIASSLAGSSLLMEMFPTAQPSGDWAVGGVAGVRRLAGFREVDRSKLPSPESGTAVGKVSAGIQQLPSPDE